MKKPPSTRAYEHASLTIGLVSIPVSVYTGTDSSHGVKRSMFTTVTNEDGTTADHPVGYGNIDKETNELVPAGQPVIKKVATEYGHVFVEDSEIEQLLDISPKTISVVEFQPQHLFYQGEYVCKSLYFIEATKTKIGTRKVDNKNAQNSLAVILAAMKSKSAMAVVEFTTRGVPKPAVLLPNGTLWCVYHTDELREQRPLPEIDVPKEVAEQAWGTYCQALWGEQPLDLVDKRAELIQAFAEEKAQAGDFGKPEETPEPMVASSGTDLLAALSASVESAKAEREVI